MLCRLCVQREVRHKMFAVLLEHGSYACEVEAMGTCLQSGSTVTWVLCLLHILSLHTTTRLYLIKCPTLIYLFFIQDADMIGTFVRTNNLKIPLAHIAFCHCMDGWESDNDSRLKRRKKSPSNGS